ncbi:MAG: SDR family oxidoreductase, partial [Acidobacteriota bacterium]
DDGPEERSIMKIGITGASGQMGAGLVRHALKRTAGSNIVGITRNPGKLEAFSKDGVEVRTGDFSAPAGLEAAFRGIERLVIVPTTDLAPGVRSRHQADAIDAAVRSGVGHVIYISTVSPRPTADNVLFDSHFATERKLMSSGIGWTILRMSIYADPLLDAAKKAVASGTYAAVPGAPAAYVVRDDIAAAAAGILATPGHAGITYHATGPVSITQQQVAEIIGEASGKPVAFAEMSAAQHRQGLEAAGLPPSIVDAVAGFQAGLREGAFDLVTGDVGRLAGKPAESVVEFLRRGLRAN